MNARTYQRLTGILFILGAVLVNIPYTLLIMNFDYPDILRTQAGHILTRFNEGGPRLVFTWLAFAWTGFPLLAAIVMVQRVLEREDTPYLWSGTVVGIIGAVAQMVGLLRWAFVVPVLARIQRRVADIATLCCARNPVSALRSRLPRGRQDPALLRSAGFRGARKQRDASPQASCVCLF